MMTGLDFYFGILTKEKLIGRIVDISNWTGMDWNNFVPGVERIGMDGGANDRNYIETEGDYNGF